MRHRDAGRQFGRPSAQRRAMFRIMVTDLLRHGRLKTTRSKAKEIRPIAERMLTLARAGGLHERRRAAAYITDESVVSHIFSDLGPRLKDRNGGYTRMLHLGPRNGDSAEMALVEIVE